MTSTRELQVLPVATGAAALRALPTLERALSGNGPALLPVSADEPTHAARLAQALGAGEPIDESTALVIATSGSTGTPKGVQLSAAALQASAHATYERLGGVGTWLLALPAHHIAGIQVLIRALVAGTAVVAAETGDGFRAEEFVRASRDLPAGDRRYASLVPTQLSRLLDDGKGLHTLREFDAILLGGSAAPPPLLARARAADIPVFTTYGMSETSGGCVYNGVPLRGLQVRLEAGQQEGVISLSGPMLASGYRGASSDAFVDGWFRTSDLGRWRDGRLEIIGRSDDVIITGGVNVAPGPIEQVIAMQQGVQDVCVLGTPDPEWGEAVTAAVVPTDPSTPPDTGELRSAVRANVSQFAVPKHVIFLRELPMRGPGKHDRRTLRAQLDTQDHIM